MPAIERIGAGQAAVTSGKWVDFAPVLTQDATNSTALAYTLSFSRFCVIGRTVFYNGRLTVNATGTVNNDIVVTLPIKPQNPVTLSGCGAFFYRDLSASADYRGVGIIDNAANNVMHFRPANLTVQADLGVNPAIPADVGDILSWAVYYEAL